MKNLLFALLLLFAVSSCIPEKKGKNDPEPELAGTYQMTRFISQSNGYNFNLPTTLNDGRTVSGEVIVNRSSDTRISIELVLIVAGRRTTETATAEIRKASGKDYDILDGGTRVGSINGTDFSIDYTSGGSREAVFARK